MRLRLACALLLPWVLACRGDHARETRTLPALPADATGVAVGLHGAVASAEAHASRAGLAVLRRGGNAIDAAITMAFALAVTHPQAGNLGGGGFMLVRTSDGQSVAIDYRETAPAAATRDMFVREDGSASHESLIGAKAAGVPGTVAGLGLAHERFGTRPWAELLAPAIGLARGHTLDARHAAELAQAVSRMREAGHARAAALYARPDGSPLAAGDQWSQPDLERTLRVIAEQGPRAFYVGALAAQLVAAVRAQSGLWTEDDLAGYRARAREPLRFSYLGHEVYTMPPPSAGGVVMRQILFASEQWRLRERPWRAPATQHLYLEAARRAYADRSEWLGDPDFVQVPTAALLSPEYLRARMQTIDPARATPSLDVAPGRPVPRESRETTHLSVVDAAGNAVSNTYTLNNSFGALVVADGTGVLLNDEMDDFAAQPGTPNLYGLVQGERNAIAPGKRMLSSMTPTILTKDGALRAVLGTPGGATISTTVTQLVRALVDYAQPLDAAVRAPRVHHQWLPDQVTTEPNVEPELALGLRALGHRVEVTGWGRIGEANCIEVDPLTSGLRAVADVTRGGGAALAY